MRWVLRKTNCTAAWAGILRDKSRFNSKRSKKGTWFSACNVRVKLWKMPMELNSEIFFCNKLKFSLDFLDENFHQSFSLKVFTWRAKIIAESHNHQSRNCQLTLVKTFTKFRQDLLFIFFVQQKTKQWLWSSVTFLGKLVFHFSLPQKMWRKVFHYSCSFSLLEKKNNFRKTTKGHKTMKWKVVRFLVFYE